MAFRQIPADIADYPFDVIVIGAGINGSGIARDATMRGLKVLLLDKGDISNGTTSWSSRLVHGGLRYLEFGEVGLVRESLHERERLLKNAPHLVKPMALVVPMYETSKHKPLLIRMGMIAYDVLSTGKSLEHHHMFNRTKILQRLPGLNDRQLLGAALYYDAQVEYAERLCFENALSAHQQGATIITYARADQLLVENGAVVGVEFTDVLQGGSYTARAPVTVNVAGPWVDDVLAGLGFPMKRMIGGTKGTHFIVDAFPGAPLGCALYYEARKDNRPILVIPWNGKYLVGTTDIRYKGDLDYVKAEEDEITYLLDETNYIIPEANLTRDSILFTYTGVRPLPFQEEGKEGSITRRHIIYDHRPQVRGLISIIGGKLTTYRSLADQAVSKIFKKLGKKAPNSSTRLVPLPGASVDIGRFSQWFRMHYSMLPAISQDHLLHVYGTRALEVVELAGDDKTLLAPFSPETGAIGAEVVFAFQKEMAQTLSDVLLRRTMVGMGPAVGIGADEAAAAIARQYLGWDEQRARKDVDEYRAYIERYHPRDTPQGFQSPQQLSPKETFQHS